MMHFTYNDRRYSLTYQYTHHEYPELWYSYPDDNLDNAIERWSKADTDAFLEVLIPEEGWVTTHQATSRCSHLDRFEKRKGREEATRKLLKQIQDKGLREAIGQRVWGSLRKAS